VDRATYDFSEPMLPWGHLPLQACCEAYLRDLAMHLVWCGCHSRLAPHLLGNIATAVSKGAQGVLKALSIASSGDPFVTSAREALRSKPAYSASAATASVISDKLTGRARQQQSTFPQGRTRTPASTTHPHSAHPISTTTYRNPALDD
jgi:hypothetical protein